MHEQVAEAESQHLSAGQVTGRMLEHLAVDAGTVERCLLALQGQVDGGNRIITEMIDTEQHDRILAVTALGEGCGHLASRRDMTDQLSDRPTVAGSLELPLIVADLGDEDTEPVGGAAQAVGTGHGVNVGAEPGPREHRRRTFILPKRTWPATTDPVASLFVANNNQTVRIGVLGCGNVGAAFVQLVEAQRDTVERRTGLRLEVTRVAVRNLSAPRDVELADGVLTRDAHAVVNDPDIDLVVEAIGGIEPARELILESLANAKPVVTANKELLANVGAELYAAADSAGRDLLFEAAVAGGIPIMRALRESLHGEPVSRVLGIINGTTNFILTKMTDAVAGGGEADYATALTEAQRLGFAERDPTADVEGFDAGAKAAIIATVAFGAKVVAGDVYHEGISRITGSEIAIAHRLGYVVKLLGIVERDSNTGDISVRVHPAMVPIHHPLASVRDSFNAVFVEGDFVDSLMFYGRGAGGAPTASAVFGDVVDAAINLRNGTHGSVGALEAASIRPIDETSAEYLLGLDVADKPGVLHSVTGVFASHGVSIRVAEQEGNGPDARLVFITHSAREADVQATVRELRDLDVVRNVGGLLRVIGD